MRCHRWALLSLILLAALTAHAQPQTVLAGPASCTACRIELEQVVVFGDSTGPGMLREQSTITTDQRGRFYVTSNFDPTITVFDGSGRFLRRIGRRGQGPGEFPSVPKILFGLGDTLYTLTYSTRRMTVFSPEYEVVRTETLSSSFTTGVRLPDGRFLLSGDPRSAATIGYPLHLIDNSGAHVRSFGSTTGAQDLFGSRGMIRRFATPLGPHIWTARLDEYVLEQWDMDGRKLAHLTRQAPWFPPKERRPPNATNGTHRAPLEMRAIAEDKAGLLWTLSLVPDREWRPRTLPPMPGAPNATYTPDSLRHKLHDSVLEVVDPARGVVLATRTLDTSFMAFIAPDLLVSYTEDAGGNPRYVVWRARMVTPSR